MIRFGMVCLALSLTAGAAKADDFTPLAALKSLSGNWIGALEYRDYQSDRWFGLPESKTIQVLEDGATVMETARFDDGPQTGTVVITTLSAFEPDGVSIASASFRKGKAMSTDVEKVHFSGPASPTAWTLVYETTGTDDNRPAHIRVTQAYTADAYTTLKEIDFSDDASEQWIVRNRSHLNRSVR